MKHDLIKEFLNLCEVSPSGFTTTLETYTNFKASYGIDFSELWDDLTASEQQTYLNKYIAL